MPGYDSNNPSFIAAIAQAQNTDVVLSVVDDSLNRAAALREEREKREQEERDKEERDARVREYERREERAAEELRERNEREAREMARREAESQFFQSSVLESYRTIGRLDVQM
jgi:hypothetical protein